MITKASLPVHRSRVALAAEVVLLFEFNQGYKGHNEKARRLVGQENQLLLAQILLRAILQQATIMVGSYWSAACNFHFASHQLRMPAANEGPMRNCCRFSCEPSHGPYYAHTAKVFSRQCSANIRALMEFGRVVAFFCLPLFLWALSFPLTVAAQESVPPDIRAAHAWEHQRVAVDWREVPLTAGTQRLTRLHSLAVYVDRRIDPQTNFTLATEGTLSKVFAETAVQLGVDFQAIEELGCFVPAGCGAQLREALNQSRSAVVALPRRWRQRFEKRSTLAWENLAEPRQLVASTLAERQIKIEVLDQIPHDVWAAGKWPSLSLGDQLTLLLFGFDLEWVPEKAGSVVRLRPITASRSEVRERPRPKQPAASETAEPDRSMQRFTLRVEQQAVGPLLKAIAARLGLKLEVSASSDASMAASLEKKISFTVDQVTFSELLATIERNSDIQIEQANSVLKVFPKDLRSETK